MVSLIQLKDNYIIAKIELTVITLVLFLKGGLYEEKSYKEYKDELLNQIAPGHNYIFVGKVGQFCPIREGCGGGLLMREKDGKYYAAGGSKGYRWLESEMVKELGKEDDIDRRYYESLVSEAMDTISQYGDFWWFADDEEELPF